MKKTSIKNISCIRLTIISQLAISWTPKSLQLIITSLLMGQNLTPTRERLLSPSTVTTQSFRLGNTFSNNQAETFAILKALQHLLQLKQSGLKVIRILTDCTTALQALTNPSNKNYLIHTIRKTPTSTTRNSFPSISIGSRPMQEQLAMKLPIPLPKRQLLQTFLLPINSLLGPSSKNSQKQTKDIRYYPNLPQPNKNILRSVESVDTFVKYEVVNQDVKNNILILYRYNAEWKLINQKSFLLQSKNCNCTYRGYRGYRKRYLN